MKKIFIIAVFTTLMVSCSKVYEGQNIDPNNPTAVNAETLLKGIELANITVPEEMVRSKKQKTLELKGF